MISPIKPNIGLQISLNMNERFYSLESPKRHCRCNHTRVLLCRIFSANYATSAALHMWRKYHFPYTIVPAPHGRKQLHESEHNSHESETVPTTNSILTQRQVGCW